MCVAVDVKRREFIIGLSESGKGLSADYTDYTDFLLHKEGPDISIGNLQTYLFENLRNL